MFSNSTILGRRIVAAAFALFAVAAHAAVGLTQIAGEDGDNPVTVFYPSSSEGQPVARGPFTLDVAFQGTPIRGNGRLIVISHGSGGNAWVHSNLARTLVEAGFVVALPLHKGDNFQDPGKPGPPSWKRRPVEVSHAIDVVGRDPRFAPLLALDKVGMYGMSAGGHTALTLAGGRWSPARLVQHCQADIARDFNGCVGLATHLTGGMMDGIKKTVALWVIRWKFNDPKWYSYNDPRIAAVVAGVPYAADFDMTSFAKPRVPLALVTAPKDIWLVPRFHSDRVLKACPPCVHLADIPNGSHGALLSPFPPVTGLLADLIGDPPGFDRSILPEVDRKIAAFFREHLTP
jgi:predicted dienelactone hydrolase